MKSDFREFRRGWPVVLASMLGVALGASPYTFYTIGLFAPELTKEFHWGFGEIQFGLLVSSISSLIAVPFVGMLTDKVGVRVVALTSCVLFGICYSTFALSTGSLLQFYATFAIVGFLGGGTLPITWTRAVNARFDKRKGLALGLCLAGTGLFGIIGKPLVAHWIATWGWRASYVALGALPILIVLPVGLFFFRESAPTGPDDLAVVEEAASAEIIGMDVAQGLRDWRFWLLAVTLIVTAFGGAGPTPNIENILSLHGISPGESAALTPFIGASVIVGRVTSGWLLDRFWAPAVGGLLLCLPAVSCVILAGSSLSQSGALLSIILIGFAAGMESDLVAFLVARYFGMKNYGSIYGILYTCYAASGALGGSAFGIYYDHYRSYEGILIASAIALVVAATSLLTLGRYRYPVDDDDAAERLARPAAAASG